MLCRCRWGCPATCLQCSSCTGPGPKGWGKGQCVWHVWEFLIIDELEVSVFQTFLSVSSCSSSLKELVWDWRAKSFCFYLGGVKLQADLTPGIQPNFRRTNPIPAWCKYLRVCLAPLGFSPTTPGKHCTAVVMCCIGRGTEPPAFLFLISCFYIPSIGMEIGIPN